ncbi:TPA: hypothetical protein EYP66_11815, partial [Candidatus Poribacteria bacterium]|nr:hypothetical protein [Candidatus Poribacteria bacterium]
MLKSYQSALPYFLTSFIGREEEVRALGALIDRKQLLTVTGFPGIGKTRLSVEVAGKVERRFQEGVRFISLEGVVDLPAAIRATASALPLSADKGQELRKQLFDVLSDCDMLLVFDAAEDVLSDEFADWISELLRLNRSLRLLVTSQRPIGLYGEQIFSLKSMTLPSTNGRVDIQEADSVRLLAARVREKISDWQLTDDNVPIVAKLCSALDGIPLALELAAGQLAPGGEETLLAEIESGISRLTATERNRLARHRSMTVVLERAWAQLSQPERQVLERLSLLNSGSFFDTDVTPLTQVENGRDIVERLYHMGLLQVENSPDAKLAAKGNRYRMLNTVRKYGRTRLDRDPELLKTLQDVMARHYLKEMEGQAFDLCPETRAMAAWLRMEAPNIRQCCQWALERKDFELLCESVHRLEQVVRGTDDLQILRKLAATAIEIATHNPTLQTKIVFYWKPLCNAGFVTDVRQFLEATLAKAWENEDARRIAFCLLVMTELQRLDGNLDQAHEYLTQLEPLEIVKYRSPWRGELLYQQSLIAWEKDEFEKAECFLRQSIDLWKELGVATKFINCKGKLAIFFEEKRDLERAVCLHQEMIEHMQRLSEDVMQWTLVEAPLKTQKIRWKHYLCGYLHAQALRYLRLNRPESAEALLRESIYWGREMDLSFHLIWALNDLVIEILCPRGEFREARSLLEEAVALAKSTGHRRIYGALLNSTAALLLAEVETGFTPLISPLEGGRYRGGLDEAKQLANQSWRIAEDLNHNYDRGHALLVLGRLRTHERSFAEAEAQLLEARAIFRGENKLLALARCLLALGNLYREQQRWEEAETCYHQAESHANRPDIRCQILHNWAAIDFARGQYDAAQSKWQEILPTCRAWKLCLVREVEIALRRSAETQGFAIYLLGSLALKYKGDDISLDELRPHSREHLAYLAFHAGKRRSMDGIFDALWEESRPSMTPYDVSFKKNLRQVVSAVRRKIASVCGNAQARQLLPHATEECYCFDPHGIVWVDLREFERALNDADRAVGAGDLMTAFNLWKFADELYRGELLAD